MFPNALAYAFSIPLVSTFLAFPSQNHINKIEDSASLAKPNLTTTATTYPTIPTEFTPTVTLALPCITGVRIYRLAMELRSFGLGGVRVMMMDWGMCLRSWRLRTVVIWCGAA
ncbi:hypothetical protein EJ02DRAFT_32005 [Clathrospora elynae]|uniref:Uncharacterized protein n=1 Tax=Clathrospora elynae TaxID=706981 RepID=A0A6A5SEK8_9PLEO|nr:hypothetical protein EJ02DRAFT_32005 [Clathrospora elynae]